MIKLLMVAVFMLLRRRKKNTIEAKRLILTHIKSRQSVTSSSNKQNYKWVMSLWKILYCSKKCHTVTF